MQDIFDEIVSIEYIGEKETIDITVSGNHLFYANDILTHNSGYDESVPGMQSMAGGMSKAYTADLAIHVNNTQQLRSKGALEFQLTKTRNSGGVGQIIEMAYDVDTLKISDQIDDPEGEKIDPHTGEVLSGNSKPSQGQDNAADRMKNLLSKIKKN